MRRARASRTWSIASRAATRRGWGAERAGSSASARGPERLASPMLRPPASTPGMPVDSDPLDLAAIEAAIIDLDGTLVDTLGDFEQALARTLADLALPAVGREFIARTV